MDNPNDYPAERGLDGVYFRIERDGAFKNLCFSDLTVNEQNAVIKRYDADSLRRLCLHLAERLRRIGDAFDIYAED